MDQPLLMSVNNILRKKKTLGNILADFPRHIVPLYAVNNGIFVGIFLKHFLIIAFQKRKNLFVRRVGFADKRSFVTVGNIV